MSISVTKRAALQLSCFGVVISLSCTDPTGPMPPDSAPVTTICSAFAAGCATDQGPKAPTAVTLGDFDGDGSLDVAVANSDSANVSVLTGMGDGAFAPSISHPAGSGIFGPNGVVGADLDGDGDVDLAVVTGEEGNAGLSILSNDGAGSFDRVGRFDNGSAVPERVIAGDLDNDGDVDLVVVNSLCIETAVLLNRGDGSFDDPSLLADAPCASSAALGDVNADGFLDLVVTSSDTLEDTKDAVSIYLNLGGTFALSTHLDAGDGPSAVAIDDFDGDGDPDLAIANSRSFDVVVLLNNGEDGFSMGGSYAVEIAPRAIVAGDWDLDGDIDIATSNTANDSVSILLNRGDAVFADQTVFAVGGEWPVDIAAGDLDGDGDLDLVTANRDSNNGSVLLNDGAGGFVLSE